MEHFVARRYGDFTKMRNALRTELPGKILPPLPKKNKSNTSAASILGNFSRKDDDDDSSVSSVSTQMTGKDGSEGGKTLSVRSLAGHRRSASLSGRGSPRVSTDGLHSPGHKSDVCLLPLYSVWEKVIANLMSRRYCSVRIKESR